MVTADGIREHPHKSIVARFLLDGASLPPIPETLPLAEQFRRALLSKCKQLALADEPGMADADIWRRSPAFWAKDDAGRPRTGHEHAFFLPTDEDGDGRLDHVTLFAAMGFNDLERKAIGALRRLTFGNREAVAVALIGGCDNSLSSFIFHPSSLILPATVWISATPFVATRYPKLRGTKRDRPEDYATPRDFARHVLRQELARRPDLPEFVAIDDVDVMGAGGLRPNEFERFRNKQGDDGGRRPAGAFRITFAAPFGGPLCLGHSCHFGLGLFLPAAEGK